MANVTCVNDKNLPDGAKLTEGKEYEIESEYVNFLDQKVYIIKGIPNSGRTKLGMVWKGYNADRFTENEKVSISEKNYEFQLN